MLGGMTADDNVALDARVGHVPQRDLIGSRDLLVNLVWSELTARYKTTSFGLLWFLLNTALMTGVLLVVFQGLVRIDVDRYPVFLLAALLPWTFFQMGLTNATGSLTRSVALIKRVRIPRMLIVLAAVVATLVHFAAGLVLMLGVLIVVGQAPGLGSVVLLLPIMAIQTVLVIGLGLALASLNVLYRDVDHLVAAAVRLGFWATPVFYPLSYVPTSWQALAALNPMANLIESYRAVLLERTSPSLGGLSEAALVSAVVLVIGVAVFTSLDAHFDDYV
jgi:ABC-type polysaccharide/polyol phosphate export permease